MINDYVGDLIFSSLGEMKQEQILHPERIYLAIDHNYPSFSVDAADKLVRLKKMAKQYGITHMTRMGAHGISHQLMVEHFVRPLEIALGTDSHATMYAGLGSFSCGITTSDALSALTAGTVWIKVPETIRFLIHGPLPVGVTAKDLCLFLVGAYSQDLYTYRAVEFTGDTIRSMSVESRLVIANLMAESGAKCAVFEADEKAYAYAGIPAGEKLSSDADAVFVREEEIDASKLEPVLACPDAVTNVHPVAEAAGKKVDQVFIGSCTNGRLEDLQQAASILKGRRVAKGTRLIVTPASQQIALEALKAGMIGTLMEAGAAIMTSSCASCAGHGPGLIGEGERCISTTNRNFKGRMGSVNSEVYLGSAYTAAASAVTGVITDPRAFLREKGGAD